jgi:VanZ family protein
MALIAVLSLLPAEDMVRTGAGGHIEHAAAYAGTALLAGLGFSRHGLSRIAAMLVVYAGVLELLQRFSPGRHPGLAGWLASSFGVLAGIGFAHCALARQRRAEGKRWAEPDAEGRTPATPRPGRGTAAPTPAE